MLNLDDAYAIVDLTEPLGARATVWAGGRPLAAEQLSDIEQLHHITASARVYNLEGLVNLHQVPAAGAYLFVGAPPLEDGSGVTVRALALVPRR